jgi:5'-3' exonuclease
MIVHLVDGTYELFRHFYGARRATNGADTRFGGVRGVLAGVLQMIEKGATHVGVATDHIIESFRNELWAGYKTGAGIDRVLWSQFHPLEEGLAAMGVAVWPMIELEADDALASAAHLAQSNEAVEKICIWTPDKDLAQCVVADRVVQVDGRRNIIRDAAAIEAKFGVPPDSIPDFLALVGDAADGYPGIPGFGKKRAAAILKRFGHIEAIDDQRMNAHRELALLFKQLATLRRDAQLFDSVDALRWRGPTPSFAAFAQMIEAPELAQRAVKASARRG